MKIVEVDAGLWCVSTELGDTVKTIHIHDGGSKVAGEPCKKYTVCGWSVDHTHSRAGSSTTWIGALNIARRELA